MSRRILLRIAERRKAAAARLASIGGGIASMLGEFTPFTCSRGPDQKQARERAVRQIVTVRGRNPRGYFPSLKAEGEAMYESLVEEDALRVAEVSRRVKSFKTQPLVLTLRDAKGEFTYTPDLLVRIAGLGEHFIEVKPDRFRRNRDTVCRLHRIRDGMRGAALNWSIAIEADLRSDNLQEELKRVLRSRPFAGKLGLADDPDAWDPRGACEPDLPSMARWAAAQARCDQLIERVVRRDSSDLLSAIQA